MVPRDVQAKLALHPCRAGMAEVPYWIPSSIVQSSIRAKISQKKLESCNVPQAPLAFSVSHQEDPAGGKARSSEGKVGMSSCHTVITQTIKTRGSCHPLRHLISLPSSFPLFTHEAVLDLTQDSSISWGALSPLPTSCLELHQHPPPPNRSRSSSLVCVGIPPKTLFCTPRVDLEWFYQRSREPFIPLEPYFAARHFDFCAVYLFLSRKPWHKKTRTDLYTRLSNSRIPSWILRTSTFLLLPRDIFNIWDFQQPE